MDVPSRHRWLVYYKQDASWILYGPDHMTDYQAVNWAQNNLESGTKYRIVEVWWYPNIESIEEMTKG